MPSLDKIKLAITTVTSHKKDATGFQQKCTFHIQMHMHIINNLTNEAELQVHRFDSFRPSNAIKKINSVTEAF
jgi:hypothetical protein